MSKYIDVSATIQVIGNIFKEPNLLDNEKYHFNEDDFPNDFHKIIFGTVYNLHALGNKAITVDSIEDYLSQRPKSLATYKANKGREYLEKVIDMINPQTFPYYYSRLKKFTLLRMYNETCGMDLSWLYDVDNILDVKKKQEQEDWLDNVSLEEIANKIDKKIENIKISYVDDYGKDAAQAGDGLMNLVEELKAKPEFGYPMYGKYMNTIFRGARLKKVYMRSAATGVGKALPNSTLIPTPDGWRKVGEIRAGDFLFDGFGKPTKVKAIYPQGQKEVWEVTFKDGRKARCCEEHLWSFCTEGQRKEQKDNRKFETKTLKEISKLPLKKAGHGYNILVPMQKAVEYKEKVYSIKPYTFGLLLGDGSFRYNSSQKSLTYSSENEILPSIIAKEMNWNFKKNSGENYNWTFEWRPENNKKHINVWVEEVLFNYPELWNVKSENKFIPKEYLNGSIEQRFDLLNGLLDSDGSVDIKGRVSYCTNSYQLKNDVIELARSLGFKVSVLEDKHKETSIVYKLEIIGQPEDKINLFKLPRKKELIMQWFNNGKKKENNLFNPIVSIQKLDYSEEMTCFYVDNKEHLFLMNDYIVTHNTRSMIADACTFACDEIYDTEEQKWIRNGTKEPTLFISTEQELSEIQTMMLAFVAGVNEEHILTGQYIDGEYERIKRAGMALSTAPLYIEELPDFSLQDIEDCIKKNIHDHDCRYICHDYIHTSMKILSEISSKAGIKGLREDNILFMIGVRLKDIANQYGVFILTATQLNGDWKEAKILDQNLLRGAKSLGDKIDGGMIMVPANQEDLEALKTIINKGGFEIPDIKISVYKNRRGRYKDVLLWCKSDRGTCRINPIFVTDYQYGLIDIKDIKINVKPKEEIIGAF